jgi:hypothetical protein
MRKKNEFDTIVIRGNIFKENVLNLLKITRKLIQLIAFKRALKQTS